MSNRPIVHRWQASLFPVNAYLVETATAVVAVDGTLGVSDGRALRAHADAIGKPLAGVIVTHSHPDHYGGVTALLNGDRLPVYAVAGVDAVIRRDDEAKERILRPMFGSEWAATRTFPNTPVAGGDRVTVGEATFRVVDAGPCESPHDSRWMLDGDGPPQVFVGDLVYSYMHAYLADGFFEEWLSNLERAKRELPKDAVLLMGHGAPQAGHALLDWQANYIRRFVEAVRSAATRETMTDDAFADAVIDQMKTVLPSEDLLFLARLSVAPLRALVAPSNVSRPADR
jgi:glyoxylase-like metal-dependent hydrolase (beta-lactamase superfamily II)